QWIRVCGGELVPYARCCDRALWGLIGEHESRVALPDLMSPLRAGRAATRFRDAPVPSGHVFEILRAGQWAPSAGNFQPVRFVVLRDRARLAELDRLARESVELSAHWFARYREGAPEHPAWTRVPLALALVADPTKW